MATNSRETAECLVAYGAPLAAYQGRATRSLEEALVEGLGLSHENATVLRALPVVLARNYTTIDYVRLRALACQSGRQAELGMLLELTAEVANLGCLLREVEPLKKPQGPPCLYFWEERTGRMARKLAEERTPAVVRSWGFLMNMSTDSFRSLLSKFSE
jgi:hypothetical protein